MAVLDAACQVERSHAGRVFLVPFVGHRFAAVIVVVEEAVDAAAAHRYFAKEGGSLAAATR